MQNNLISSFKSVDEMTPTEMIAEIILLRRLANHLAQLTAERTYLYMLLQQHNIIPIFIPDNEEES